MNGSKAGVQTRVTLLQSNKFKFAKIWLGVGKSEVKHTSSYFVNISFFNQERENFEELSFKQYNISDVN